MATTSRPSRHTPAPPPLTNTEGTICRSHRVTRTGLDGRIEGLFVRLLNGQDDEHDVPGSGTGGRARSGRRGMSMRKKGERRVVLCSEVEGIMFPESAGLLAKEEQEGKGNGAEGEAEWKSVMMDDSDPEQGGIPIPTNDKHRDIAPSTSRGTASDPRLAGMQRAQNRERVRQAARRGVVFGFLLPAGEGGEERGRRRAEAVQNGRVVEASFAKGEWGVRWFE
ncbi:MAG: hypothetical protein M1830_010631 [Pleopsidium flavum]|nr:MAG: hypothetical protein M1830_010631 [Pleopsidium flavum]